MYTIINSEPGVYSVGFYSPNNEWHTYENFADKEKAEEKCNYLNGGKGLKPVLLIRIPEDVSADFIHNYIRNKKILELREDYWVFTVFMGDEFSIEILTSKEINQQRFKEIESTIFNFLNKF